MTMDRNLSIVNNSPPRPTLVCRKITGPPSWSFTAAAITNMKGAIAIRPIEVKMRSLARFHQATPASEVGLFHVDQRESHQRPDVHARTRNLNETWVHEQLDPRTFQRPRKLPQVAVPRRIVAGHGNGIASQRMDDACYILKVAQHGDFVDDWSRQLR
jgi:hypothetical protein